MGGRRRLPPSLMVRQSLLVAVVWLEHAWTSSATILTASGVSDSLLDAGTLHKSTGSSSYTFTHTAAPLLRSHCPGDKCPSRSREQQQQKREEEEEQQQQKQQQQQQQQRRRRRRQRQQQQRHGHRRAPREFDDRSTFAASLSPATRESWPDKTPINDAFELAVEDAAGTDSDRSRKSAPPPGASDEVHDTPEADAGTVGGNGSTALGDRASRGDAAAGASPGGQNYYPTYSTSTGEEESGVDGIQDDRHGGGSGPFLHPSRRRRHEHEKLRRVAVERREGLGDDGSTREIRELDVTADVHSFPTRRKSNRRTVAGTELSFPDIDHAAESTGVVVEESLLPGGGSREQQRAENIFSVPEFGADEDRRENEERRESEEIKAESAPDPRQGGDGVDKKLTADNRLSTSLRVSGTRSTRELVWPGRRRRLQAREDEHESDDAPNDARNDGSGSTGLLAFAVCFGLFLCVVEVAKCYCLVECRRRTRIRRQRQRVVSERMPIAISRPVASSVPGPELKGGLAEVVVDAKIISGNFSVDEKEMPSAPGYPVADASNVLREASEHAERLSPRDRNVRALISVPRSPLASAGPPRPPLLRTRSRSSPSLGNLLMPRSSRGAVAGPFTAEPPSLAREDA